MSGMFRSEEMDLAQLFVSPEAAYGTMSELGELGIVQFRDLNEDVSSFQRNFVNEVRRCDELERKLRYIEDEIRKDEVKIPELSEFPRAPIPREIIDLEAHLEKTENEIRELSDNSINLNWTFLELTQLKHVLHKAQTFFMDREEHGGDAANRALIPEDAQVTGTPSLSYVAGVLNRDKVAGFERMLWRISRGNVFLRQGDIEEPLKDPATGNELYKTVFLAFFQGEQLKSRVKKICTGYHATLYTCPSTVSECKETLKGVETRLQDLSMVLNQTGDHRQRVLVNVAKELQNWNIMVRKMKAIYHILNMFSMDVTQKILIGECWVPRRDVNCVRSTLSNVSQASGSPSPSFLNIISTRATPPTYNRTNKFTRGFQNLIDSYGVASYREVNPALYTIVTFPFLFAVMFGDIGHGVILFLYGLYMCLKEKKWMDKKIESEYFKIIFAGRYIVLLMGAFSIYTGLIYNDVFSKSVNIFGTSWMAKANALTLKNFTYGGDVLMLNPTDDYGGEPYPLGMDPVWQLGKNKIIFHNSHKMKMSIIFGVVHMIFGVCLSVVNYSQFRKMENFLLMFLPQIIFLVMLFLWMVIMMFMKWIMYDALLGHPKTGSSCAPSILIFFINMVLLKESKPPEGCDIYMFDGQKELQLALLIIALLCIPVMLIGKPIYILATRRRFPIQGAEASHDNHENDSAGEIFIGQGIHTIEYVLSTVSHTASYLRLWALSLAHGQLSEVLWNMVMQMAFKFESWTGIILLYLIFGFWAGATVAILVTMEGLSAFLHTLRLHWVEFMSKFYEGLGYPFQPYCFKRMFQEEDEAD